MSSIPEFMTTKHRECDELFINAENAVAKGDWQLASTAFAKFSDELELHFQTEENILFPRFEQATGMTQGPTQVMRMEHQQMRALVSDLLTVLAAKNKDNYLSASETLMVLMQQHNMKEEMMLYPMTQQNVPELDKLLATIVDHCAAHQQ